EKALAAYQEIAGRYPIEARSLLTHGTFTRFTIGMGLGEAIWMTELRTIPTGNPEYRRLAQLMWNELTNLMPDMKVVGKYVDMEWYSLGRIKEAVKADLKGRG
ncbi:FAD-dependent thymidylate synthase, partial [Candidatus Collierbacteria bacterium]|nr:FAD-dependent thymidylate synthase [Candidatus Collierbacteria bacterium]